MSLLLVCKAWFPRLEMIWANLPSRDEEDCEAEVDVLVYTEPTSRWNDLFFVNPKPKWYDCSRTG